MRHRPEGSPWSRRDALLKLVRRRPLLTAGALWLLAAGLVRSGALDWLGGAGRLDRGAVVGSLLVHGLAALAVAAAVAAVRRGWKAAVVLLGTTAVTLAVAELGLRAVRPELAWEPFIGVPSRRYHHEAPAGQRLYHGAHFDDGVTVETNRDALRSPYRRDRFRRYTTRLAVLGDSFTFGVGVADDAAFPAVLERRLRASLERDDVAVLNAGMISYSPLLQTVVYPGKVRGYQPQVVLMLLDATDFGDDVRYQRRLRRDSDRVWFDVVDRRRPRPSGALMNVTLLPRRLAEYHLRYPWVELGRRLGFALANPPSPFDLHTMELRIGGVVEHNVFFIYRHPPELTRPYFERTLGYVEQVAAEVRADGGRFVLAVAPRFHHWDASECPDNWEAHRYALDEPYQHAYLDFFRDRAPALGFPVIDLLPAFLSSDRGPLVFARDPHWNVAGHELVGAFLSDRLLDLGVLDRDPMPAVPPGS